MPLYLPIWTTFKLGNLESIHLKELFLIITIFGIIFSGHSFLQTALAQEIGGGVDLPGDWYAGEGLKKGD